MAELTEAEKAAAAQLLDLRQRASRKALYSTDIARERTGVLQTRAETIRRSTDDLNAVKNDLTNIKPAIENQRAYEAQQATYTE